LPSLVFLGLASRPQAEAAVAAISEDVAGLHVEHPLFIAVAIVVRPCLDRGALIKAEGRCSLRWVYLYIRQQLAVDFPSCSRNFLVGGFAPRDLGSVREHAPMADVDPEMPISARGHSSALQRRTGSRACARRGHDRFADAEMGRPELQGQKAAIAFANEPGRQAY
jgi:hypothetical protein